MKPVFRILILVLFFILSARAVFAAMELSAIPAALTGPEELNGHVVLTGLTANGTYYLKGAFHKEGSTNYFGENWNGAAWVKYGEDKSIQQSISIGGDGNWEGDVRSRIDAGDSGFSGSGTYYYKVGRLTSSGSTITWSAEFPIEVSYDAPITITPELISGTVSPSPGSSSQFSVVLDRSTLTGEEETGGTVSLSGLSGGAKYFLKGAFFKDGSTNYFGYTKVNGAFVKNGSSYSSQLEITADESGNWTGHIAFKPDQADSGYGASGTYSFKVGRYNASGSGPVWSSVVAVSLTKTAIGTTAGTGTTATKAPSKTPTPTKTTAKSPTGTSPSVTSAKITASGKTTGSNTGSSKGTDETKVLDASYEAALASGSGDVKLGVNDSTKQPVDARIFLTGVVLIAAGGFLAFQKWRSLRMANQELELTT